MSQREHDGAETPREESDAFDAFFGPAEPQADTPATGARDVAPGAAPAETSELPVVEDDEDTAPRSVVAAPGSREPDPAHEATVVRPARTSHAASDDESPTQVARPPAVPADDADFDSVPTGWWSTEPADRPTQTAAPAASAGTAAPRTSRAAGGYVAPSAPAPARRQQRGGLSPVALVALLVGGVLVGALAMLAITRGLGDDDSPAAGGTVTTTAESSESASESTSEETSESPSSSSSATRRGELPSGATACAGAVEGTAVARGNDVTTCEFAEEVRGAYLEKASDGGDVSLRVRSPVTRKNYTMRCTGSSVTVCTGGNNAVVYLY